MLKRVAQAELELPFGRVRRAFARNLAKRAAGGVYVRIIPVGMVGEVERLCPEDQRMVLMAGDDVEALLERRIPALETRPINNVARSARGKCADGGRLKYSCLKPLSARRRAKLVRKGRCPCVHVVLIAGTWTYARLVEVARHRS